MRLLEHSGECVHEHAYSGRVAISVCGNEQGRHAVQQIFSDIVIENRGRRNHAVDLTGLTVNLPNSITMSRIVMIPLLLWILSPHFPWQDPRGKQEFLAAILFVLASITDGVDGYLARKRGQITTMGMLLDPLADKIMVTGAIIALVAYIPEVVKVWIAVVIIGREFLISGLRSIAASEGFTIQASDLGKLEDGRPDRFRGFGHPRPSLVPVGLRMAGSSSR